MSKTPAIARAAATTPNRVEFGAPSAGAVVEGHSVKQQSVGSQVHVFRLHAREVDSGQGEQHGVVAQQAARSAPVPGQKQAGEPRHATWQSGLLTAQNVQPTLLVLNNEKSPAGQIPPSAANAADLHSVRGW